MKSQKLIQIGMLVIILFLLTVIFLQTKDQAELQSLELKMNATAESENLRINDFQNQVTELAGQLKNLEKNRQDFNEIIQQHAMEISKVRKLISSIPQIQPAIAFITSVSQDDDNLVELDYVEWLVGDEAIEASGGSAPNGFYVRNKTVENVSKMIDDHSDIYILDGAAHKYIDVTGFKDNLKDSTHSLFWIYEINERIVLIEEQYIP